MKDNSATIMREWWNEYQTFMREVARVKKLTKKQVSQLPNIRVKI